MAIVARLRSIGNGELEVHDPLAGGNAEYTLTWDGSGHLIQIDRNVGEFNYRRTLTWTGDDLTSISHWVKLP